MRHGRKGRARRGRSSENTLAGRLAGHESELAWPVGQPASLYVLSTVTTSTH